jgi:hypothetical protein
VSFFPSTVFCLLCDGTGGTLGLILGLTRCAGFIILVAVVRRGLHFVRNAKM